MAYMNNLCNRVDIPDGDYIVKVLDVERGQTKAEAKPFLKFLLEIAEGPHQGKCDEKTSWLTSNDSRSQVRRELQKMGMTLNHDIDYADFVDRLTQTLVRVTVKNGKDGNRSIYFSGLAKPQTGDSDSWGLLVSGL
jgi:hypothetical protein